MILDKQNLFSEDQAVTVTANSTNIIDLGADDAAIASVVEKNAMLFAQVTTAFAGGTSVQIGLYTDSNEDMSTEVLLHDTAAIADASLVAGYQFRLGCLPIGCKRYLRLTYTSSGTHSAGNILSGLLLDVQTNV